MQKIIRFSAAVTLGVLAYVPFHALISTFLIDIFGGKLPFKGLKELVVLLLAIPVTYIVIRNSKKLLRSNLTLAALTVAYASMWLVSTMISDTKTIAEVAGLITALRFLGFFAICYFVAQLVMKRAAYQNLAIKIVLYCAAVVVVFGALQVLVLPKDFLVIFGYGPDTIRPYLTIDNNESLVRILSTLRGPNPLGAYLALLAPLVLWFGRKHSWEWWKWLLVALPFLVTLYGTGSRSGWLGFIIAVGAYLALSLKNKKILYVAAVACLPVLFIAVLFRNTEFVQVTILHRDPNEASEIDSDDQRIDSLARAIERINERPLGHGVGTSGPASNYAESSFIIENYFLDIAYQIGWLGMLLFMALCVYVAILLLRMRSQLGYALVAGLISVSVIALFWPVWTDETVALTWWGLAGIVLGVGLKKNKQV